MLGILFVVGCVAQNVNRVAQTPSSVESKAIEECTALCFKALAEGRDLNKGPCLSNEVAPGWVCDIAHNPRESIDNDPANQCPAYGKTANHFVELDPQCNFIRSY